MKRDKWIVDDTAVRPASVHKDRCFYCGEMIGSEHRSDCVMRSRTVVVRMTVEYTIKVPETWNEDQIEFFRNEGSWCSSNALDELVDIQKHHHCLCYQTSFEYVREATEADEQRDGVSVSSE